MVSPDDAIVSPDDLGAYLGVATIDEDRAWTLIGYAQTLCQSIVTPLPDGAGAVVLDVAARAFVNPTNAQSETTGPYSVSRGPVSGGLWLTKQNIATLRRLNGGGGAFTIDPTPATAGQGMPWWDSNIGFWTVPWAES